MIVTQVESYRWSGQMLGFAVQELPGFFTVSLNAIDRSLDEEFVRYEKFSEAVKVKTGEETIKGVLTDIFRYEVKIRPWAVLSDEQKTDIRKQIHALVTPVVVNS